MHNTDYKHDDKNITVLFLSQIVTTGVDTMATEPLGL